MSHVTSKTVKQTRIQQSHRSDMQSIQGTWMGKVRRGLFWGEGTNTYLASSMRQRVSNLGLTERAPTLY